MKKRCNFYIEEDNVEYLRDNNINTSKMIDNFLTIYVDLMRMSEDDLVIRMNELKQEIAEKTTELRMIEKRLLGVDE